MVPINYKGLGLDGHEEETSSNTISASKICSHTSKNSLGNLTGVKNKNA